jgi:hypothetical protein
LNLAIWFSRGGVKWAEDDFMFRARMLLGSKLERLGVVRWAGAKPVPRDRICPRGAQPFPNAQQFASIGAATRNAMHFRKTW